MTALILLPLFVFIFGCTAATRINVPESQRSATVRVDAVLPDDVKEAFVEAVRRSQFTERFGETDIGWAAHGSGFLVRESPQDSIVLITNRHVVEGADDVTLMLDDQTPIEKCEVLYVDDRFDLAVVALPDGAASRSMPVLPLSDLEIHDKDGVLAAGYPMESDRKLSYRSVLGHVSKSKHTIQYEGSEHVFIQHTAAIDAGSRGGPLFKAGSIEVIGVNTLALQGGDSPSAAIPSSIVKRVLRRALLTPRPHDMARSARLLTQRCEELIDEMTIGGAPPRSTLEILSNRFVAAAGLPAWESRHIKRKRAVKTRGNKQHRAATENDEIAMSSLIESIQRGNAMEHLRGYAFGLLYTDANTNGNIRQGSCKNILDKDLKDYDQRRSVRIRIDFDSGRRRILSWRFEQGHWRLTKYE